MPEQAGSHLWVDNRDGGERARSDGQKEILARGYPRAPRAPLLGTSLEEGGNSSWGTERDGPNQERSRSMS